MANLPPRTTLEQWAVLRAVVEHGGFEAAAEALRRSQSSVSYAIRRLQEQLPVALLETRGRRAELTEAGALLLRRATSLLDAAGDLERLAGTLAQGWETEVRLAVEIVCPPELVLCSLAEFSARAPQTRVELIESVLSGTSEALLQRRADLAVTGRVPPGFLGDPLVEVEFLAVAAPSHPLVALEREVTEDDLRGQRQVVVRDTGLHRRVDSGWLEAEQRWTVSHLRTAIATLSRGLAFAWIPVDFIREELEHGTLVELPLREGRVRRALLHLVYGDRDGAGPATRALAEALVAQARRHRTAASG